MATALEALGKRVRAGEVPAIARMITHAERRTPGYDHELAELYRSGGRARIIGITGSPGTGKSTLIGALTLELRRRGFSIGVVAVDPSSPYSGGAILGDRIRLAMHSGDEGVYVRSMATRGALGGLSRAAMDAVMILDAAGRDVILIETVGVGQDEVEIATASHTTVVVSVPGLGDDIQAMKAGVTEIADIHVVNKADLAGADRVASELTTMLNLAGETPDRGWSPPVLKTAAATGAGIAELANTLEMRAQWLAHTGHIVQRELEIASRRIRSLATAMLMDQLVDPQFLSTFEAEVDATSRRTTDPASAARRLIRQLN